MCIRDRQIPEVLTGYTFIPLKDQLSEKWLGSAAAKMKATAEFLKTAGRIDTCLLYTSRCV